MAIDNCNLSVMEPASACFRCLSDPELDATVVYMLALALVGLRGTDLTNAADLQAATECYNCHSEHDLKAFLAVTAYNLAVAEGGIAETPDIGEIKSAVRPIVLLGKDRIQAAAVFLLCSVLETMNAPA